MSSQIERARNRRGHWRNRYGCRKSLAEFSRRCIALIGTLAQSLLQHLIYSVRDVRLNAACRWRRLAHMFEQYFDWRLTNKYGRASQQAKADRTQRVDIRRA